MPPPLGGNHPGGLPHHTATPTPSHSFHQVGKSGGAAPPGGFKIFAPPSSAKNGGFPPFPRHITVAPSLSSVMTSTAPLSTVPRSGQHTQPKIRKPYFMPYLSTDAVMRGLKNNDLIKVPADSPHSPNPLEFRAHCASTSATMRRRTSTTRRATSSRTSSSSASTIATVRCTAT